MGPPFCRHRGNLHQFAVEFTYVASSVCAFLSAAWCAKVICAANASFPLCKLRRVCEYKNNRSWQIGFCRNGETSSSLTQSAAPNWSIEPSGIPVAWPLSLYSVPCMLAYWNLITSRSAACTNRRLFISPNHYPDTKIGCKIVRLNFLSRTRHHVAHYFLFLPQFSTADHFCQAAAFAVLLELRHTGIFKTFALMRDIIFLIRHAQLSSPTNCVSCNSCPELIWQ